MLPDLSSPALSDHVALLCDSYLRWTRRPLLAGEPGAQAAVRALHGAPFAVVSHDTQAEPVFNYGNELALHLFEMRWDEFTRLRSRLSTEAEHQDERRRLLAEVSERGYADNYSGIRIAKSGRRFYIHDATVWNLIDAAGQYRGQAALIRRWDALPQRGRHQGL